MVAMEEDMQGVGVTEEDGWSCKMEADDPQLKQVVKAEVLKRATSVLVDVLSYSETDGELIILAGLTGTLTSVHWYSFINSSGKD